MIAISYRRDDSLPVAGRLYDRLQAEFGKGQVFMDFDSIPYGVDFRDHIRQMIGRSKLVIAMIGSDWLGRKGKTRRIDDSTDFVRLEIAYALECKVPVIPVLIGNARMPKPEQLPKDIEGLAFRNALNLDAGIDFHHHTDRLIAGINRLLLASVSAAAEMARAPEISPIAPQKPSLPTPKESSPAPSPQAPAVQPSKPKTKSVRPPVPIAPIAETPVDDGPKAEPAVAVPTVSKEPSSSRQDGWVISGDGMVVEEVPQHPKQKLSPGMIIPAETSPKSEAVVVPSPTEKQTAKTPAVSKPVVEIEKPKLTSVPAASRPPPSVKPPAMDSPKSIESPMIPAAPKSETVPSKIGQIRDDHRLSLGESPPGLLQTTETFKPPTLPPKPPRIPEPNEIDTKVPSQKPGMAVSTPARPKSISWFAKAQKRMARLQDKMSADYFPKDHLFNKGRKTLDDFTDGTKARVFGAIAIIGVLFGITWFAANRSNAHRSGTMLQPEPGLVLKPPAGIVPQDRAPGKSSGPSVASVPPAPSGTALRGAAPGAPASPLSPHLKGTLRIDSTPAGVAFEIVDGDFNQRTGTTPAALELPTGYTRIIFKWKTFEHREDVWLEGGKVISTTWSAPVEAGPAGGQTSDSISPAGRPPAAPTQAPSPLASPSETAAASAQLSATVSSGRGDRTWQAWIGDFVRQFVMSNQSQDIAADLALYAPSVDYFGDRNTNQTFIRTDVEKYNVRWPIRHDSIDGDIHLQEKVPDRDYTANFKLNFYAESQERHIWTKGQFQIDMEISIVDGTPKIVGIKEKMLHQQKGVPAGPPKQSPVPARYPVGIPVAGKRGFAKSPYAPAKNDLDLRRFKKGSEVKCPYTGKIFIVP